MVVARVKVSFQGEECVLKLTLVVMVAISVNILKTTELYTSNGRIV